MTASRESDFKLTVGVDEAGRGSWAGPVTVAAVILDSERTPAGLADSKKLSKARRETLFEEITATAQFCVVHVEVADIDRMNILQATLLGMRRAILGVGKTLDGGVSSIDCALIDGNQIPKDLPCEARAIIGGDDKVACISAASILAKVSRDRLMAELARDYPGYFWEKNAGYGTKLHQSGLQDIGVTPHHRRSFKPIHKMLLSGGVAQNS